MIKAVINYKSNLKAVEEAVKKTAQYKKVLYQVAGKLAVDVRSKTPVKKEGFSSGRKDGALRIKQSAGNLKKSIGVFDSKSTNYVRVWVGARVKGNYDGWYAQIVESGHYIYKNTLNTRDEKGKSIRHGLKRWRDKNIPEKTQGFVAANPFITNTFNSQKTMLESELKTKLAVNLETLIKQNNV